MDELDNNCIDTCNVENSMTIIRNKLREAVEEHRKHNRDVKINKLRRVALGDEFYCSNQRNDWTSDQLIQTAKNLKKKTLSRKEYVKLIAALLQDEENISRFMSVGQMLPALVRDLSSTNPETQMLALYCCCNISLGNSRISGALCKYAGPYLITQLETHNNPLLEICTWTIGNLCSSSIAAHETLDALGCFDRLLSLLQNCQVTILSSTAYAITLYLYGNKNFTKISEFDLMRLSKILVQRVLNDNHISCEVIWLLALLSSALACRNDLALVASPMLMHLITIMKTEAETLLHRSKEITALVRFFANLSATSEVIADMILNKREMDSSFTSNDIFNKLLVYPYNHVRREILWLIGNLYNHSSPRICILMQNYLQLLNSNQIMEIMREK